MSANSVIQLTTENFWQHVPKTCLLSSKAALPKLSGRDHCLGGRVCQLPALQHWSNYVSSSLHLSTYVSSDAFTHTHPHPAPQAARQAGQNVGLFGVPGHSRDRGVLWPCQHTQPVVLTPLTASFPQLKSTPKLHLLLIFFLLPAQTPFKAEQAASKADLPSSAMRSIA